MFALLLALSASAEEPNRLTLGAGAAVVRASPAAEKLAGVAIDGSTQTLGVGIPKREPLPLTVVIELPAPTTLQRFDFPPFTQTGSAKGRHAKTVRIEGSSTSADDGFSPLVDVVLREGTDQPQSFAVPSPRAVRWVRVTLVDRHTPPSSDVDPTNFTELEGYGPQEPIPARSFTGTWRARRLGLNDTPGTNVIALSQDGTSIQGCEVIGGQHFVVTGSVDAGLARLVRDDGKGVRKPFTAVLLADGELSGVTFAGPPRAFWAAPDPGAASPCAPPVRSNPIEASLAAGGTAVVHGIHFDVDSDRLRPDAEPALRQLLAALQALPERSVTIEGHTDSQASDAHNLDLSERRAKAVIGWLTGKGVAAGRLTPSGKGEAHPIADNDSSAGRALNRRVEVR